MFITKMTTKGQVTIPKKVRDSLKLHTGDRIVFEIHSDKEARITPVSKSVNDVFGRLSCTHQQVQTVEEMNAAVAKRMKKHAK